MHAFALLGKETRINALVVKRLDQLPLYPAHQRDRDANRGLSRQAVFAPILDVAGLELVDLPGADPIVLDVPSYRRVEVAHDDTDLHRLK
jgi:hypothetical protein